LSFETAFENVTPNGIGCKTDVVNRLPPSPRFIPGVPFDLVRILRTTSIFVLVVRDTHDSEDMKLGPQTHLGAESQSEGTLVPKSLKMVIMIPQRHGRTSEGVPLSESVE